MFLWQELEILWQCHNLYRHFKNNKVWCIKLLIFFFALLLYLTLKHNMIIIMAFLLYSFVNESVEEKRIITQELKVKWFSLKLFYLILKSMVLKLNEEDNASKSSCCIFEDKTSHTQLPIIKILFSLFIYINEVKI